MSDWKTRLVSTIHVAGDKLNRDEGELLLDVVDQALAALLRGREEYGPLDIENDNRHPMAVLLETMAEPLDQYIWLRIFLKMLTARGVDLRDV